MLGQLHGVGLGQAADGPFGGAVVGEEGKGLEADDAGGGDEFAWRGGGAVFLFDQLFGCGGEAVLHAGYVDLGKVISD